jgi:hypothetical protein
MSDDKLLCVYGNPNPLCLPTVGYASRRKGRLRSSVFYMSAQDALHWMEKSLCHEHQGFNVQAEYHQRALIPIRNSQFAIRNSQFAIRNSQFPIPNFFITIPILLESPA